MKPCLQQKALALYLPCSGLYFSSHLTSGFEPCLPSLSHPLILVNEDLLNLNPLEPETSPSLMMVYFSRFRILVQLTP